MARFRLEIDMQRAAMALVACGTLVACSASSAARESSTSDVTKRFIASLLKHGSAKIERDWKSCLAASSAPATVTDEFAAILGWYIDADWPFAITAGCEAGESSTRQFCRMDFHHRDGDNEASAGFLFYGNPADGSIDLKSLNCYQTP